MDLYHFNYPIETELQVKFWSSNHIGNIMKAFVAFSLDETNFRELAIRYGYTRPWRDRVWAAYAVYVNTPDLTGVPFSEATSGTADDPYGGDNWWTEMPNIETPSDKFFTIVPAPTPVYVEPIPDPVLTILPLDVTSVEGATVTLTSDATGYDKVEWFEGYTSLGLTTSIDVIAANDNTLHSYRVEFSIEDAEYGTRRSTSAAGSVKGVSGVSDITLDPVGGNGDEVAGYQLTSIGVGHSSIQWQSQNAYLLWTDIVGATTADYLYIAPYNGRYVPLRVQYKNSYGTTTSEEAQVYLAKNDIPPIPTSPVVTLDPVDTSVIENTSATFTADATDYVSVAWEFSGTGASYIPVPEDSGTTTLVTDPRPLGNDGNFYRAVFTNVIGSTITLPAQVTVTPI